MVKILSICLFCFAVSSSAQAATIVLQKDVTLTPEACAFLQGGTAELLLHDGKRLEIKYSAPWSISGSGCSSAVYELTYEDWGVLQSASDHANNQSW
jgi:hypothetical protein